MTLPDGNPRIPEGINARDDHPVREFLLLAFGVTLVLLAAVFALAVSASWLAPHIPFTWELKASPAVSSLLEDDSAGENDAAELALEKLARELLDTSLSVPLEDGPVAEEVPPHYFSFSLLDMDAPNAFATLGAAVAVTDGLLDEVHSENGLAMVIAHEIAHVQLRHPIESVSRGLLVQIALAAVLGDSSTSMLGGTLSSGGLLTILSFNRDMELEADARALEILRAHYGHVVGADEFFREIAAGDTQTWLEFTQTHPSPEARLDLIRQAMADDPAGSATKPMPEALRDPPE